MTHSTQAVGPADFEDEKEQPGVTGTVLHASKFGEGDIITNEIPSLISAKDEQTPNHGRYEVFLRGAVNRVLNLLDAEHCSIALIDKKTGELVTRASSRVGNSELLRQSRFRQREGIAGHVAATRASFLSNNVHRATQYMKIGDDKIASIMCAPLIHKKDVLGTITVTSPRFDAFTTDHLKLLEELSDREAVGIAQLFHSDASLRETDKVASLLHINEIVANSAHRDTLTTRVLEWIGENLPPCEASILLFGNKTHENSFYGSPLAATLLLMRETAKSKVWSAKLYDINQFPLLSPENLQSLQTTGIKHIALASLYRQQPENVIGLVVLLFRQRVEDFQVADLELLEELAHKISEGLEIADRFRYSQETRYFLSQFTQGAGDPVVELDLEGQVREWNEAAEVLFGYSAEEIIGRILPGQQAEISDIALYEQVRQGATLANVLIEKLDKSGNLLSLSVTLAPILDQSGNVSRISLLVKDITETTRLKQEAARRNQEMTNLSDIALRLASTLDTNNLLVIIKDHLSRVVEFDALLVATHNEVKNIFEVELHSELGVYYAPESWPSTEPMLAWLLQHGRQLTIDSSDTDFPLNRFQGMEGENPENLLITPTRLEGQVNGFIALANYHAQPFKPYHKQLMLIVASQAAIALEKARILRRSQEKAEHLSILRQVAKATSSSLNLDEVLKNMVIELHRNIIFDTADIQMFGPTGLRRYLVTSNQGGHQSLRSEVIQIDPALEEFAEKLNYSTPLTSLNQTNPLHARALELFGKRNLQAGVLVPLIYGDRVSGLMQLGSYEDYNYTEDELALISDIASQAIGAMENAQLHEVVKHQVAQLEQQGRRERRLLQETAQERERLEAIFGNSSDGIVVIDEEFNILRLNPAMASYIGADNSVIGRKCTQVLRCQDKEGNLLCEIACPLQKVLGQSEPLLHQEVRLDNQGKLRTVSTNWNVVPSASGGSNVVSTMRDVTALREVEQMKANFISTVSHELRNPINVINGFTKMLAEERAGQLNPVQHEFVSSMLVSVNQLKKLAEDILIMSRVDADRFSINPGPISFKDIVVSTAKNSRPMIYAKNIRLITAQLPDNPVIINADEMRLCQCLGNLLENAIKFTPQGGRIVIELKTDGDNAKLSVTDSGIGIAQEHLVHIFERFYQVQDEETRKMRGAQLGSGLGLSITKEIIERHGGRIWVESTVGKGTIFSFTLPLLKESLG